MPTGIYLRTLLPAPAFTDKGLRTRLRAFVRRNARSLSRDFAMTTDNWETPVTFREHTTASTRTGELGFAVETDSPIYARVNNGTPPHFIPKGRFPRAPMPIARYAAKTKPNVVYSYPGGRMEPPAYFARGQVWHPGFPGRNFDDALLAEWEGRLEEQLQEDLDEWVNETGYAY